MDFFGMLFVVVCGCDSTFLNLESTIFFSTLFECEINSLEHKLFSLPSRLGGLGIIDPVISAARLHNVLVHATAACFD